LCRKLDGRLRDIIDAIKQKRSSCVPCDAGGCTMLQLGMIVIA
jgi:hypothetical protein